MSHPDLLKQTVGGLAGHIFRRMIHLGMLLIPVCYHYWGVTFSSKMHMLPAQLVGCFLAIVIIAEIIRLWRGYVLFAQRKHEANHISSFAWGAIAMSIVLMLAPNTLLAIVIVTGCAIGDPLLGELRHQAISEKWVAAIGIILIAAIWWVSLIWVVFPWWIVLIIAPLTVAAEWPKLHWIDDNALMQLVPLIIVMTFR